MLYRAYCFVSIGAPRNTFKIVLVLPPFERKEFHNSSPSPQRQPATIFSLISLKLEPHSVSRGHEQVIQKQQIFSFQLP